MLKTLEERVLALEDTHAIINLKARYLRASNGGWDRPSHNAEAVAATFADDGWWQAEGFARLEGRAAIRDGFETFSALAPFAFHAVFNPCIEVYRDSAVGEWHLNELFTDAKGEEFWAAGVYTDHFIRTPEGWLINSLSLVYAYNGPCKGGWAQAVRTTERTR